MLVSIRAPSFQKTIGLRVVMCFWVGYRSGQPGQTVNLLAYAYVGSNPTPTMGRGSDRESTSQRDEPVGLGERFAGVAQLARASAFQAEGRRFKPERISMLIQQVILLTTSQVNIGNALFQINIPAIGKYVKYFPIAGILI